MKLIVSGEERTSRAFVQILSALKVREKRALIAHRIDATGDKGEERCHLEPMPGSSDELLSEEAVQQRKRVLQCESKFQAGR